MDPISFLFPRGIPQQLSHLRSLCSGNTRILISGYSFAVFTGVYRTLNDKHRVSDVVAGEGFGILSTELAYYLYPKINTLFTGKNKKEQR